jgi:hypothetical protein
MPQISTGLFCLGALVLASGDSDYQSDVNYASDLYRTILFRSPGLGKLDSDYQSDINYASDPDMTTLFLGAPVSVRCELHLESVNDYSFKEPWSWPAGIQTTSQT